MRPRALDLFSGAGGVARGLQRAGFHVTGVDLRPQPRYAGDYFVQGDALRPPFDLADFDFVWASPPCQDHVRAPGAAGKHGTGWMLAATRKMLVASGASWAIENVPGAPMQPHYRLFGSQFGLTRLKRERWFETSWSGFDLLPEPHYDGPVISVTGNGTPTGTWQAFGSLKLCDFQEVMGIDWMTRAELSQAIPPAYSEFIGRAALAHLSMERAA